MLPASTASTSAAALMGKRCGVCSSVGAAMIPVLSGVRLTSGSGRAWGCDSPALVDYLRAYDSVSDAALRSAFISASTMAGDHTRALTARHPIKPTSTRCHSAWQPNPGRRSTYRRGKSVQTTGTTAEVAALAKRWSRKSPAKRTRRTSYTSTAFIVGVVLGQDRRSGPRASPMTSRLPLLDEAAITGSVLLKHPAH
jgi:hypothetical protein